MEEIITPVPLEILEKELTADKIIRPTNNGSNIIYVVTAENSPNVMMEIGRLRELSFRHAGGGTGLPYDIDEDDTATDGGYKQLVVWDPDAKQIIGGYRYIVCRDTNPKHFSTEHYFEFSEKFREEYLPHTIELGRSFVQPCYQGRAGGIKSLFALDNLWDGLGFIAANNPDMHYYFGKVTMYEDYNNFARIYLFCFLQKHFPDRDNLVTPIEAKSYNISSNEEIEDIFTGDYQSDYKALVAKLKEYGEAIPPLINAYVKLSPNMKLFGTVVNSDFGAVHETGILISIKDIYKDKYTRYIDSACEYLK